MKKYDYSVEKATDSLSEAIKISTVSYSDTSKVDYDKYEEFLEFLDSRYENIANTCEKTIVNEYAPVYLWSGESQDLPILLIAHYDVVPIDNPDNWKYGPFSGYIIDGEIWGRGAIDDKHSVIGLMEAVDYLISTGRKPKRDIYLAFGFDEETGGSEGATKVAEYFSNQGIRFECILDEGGMISDGVLDGIDDLIALVGLAEKSTNHIKITTTGKGGHGSMPPKNTAIGKLAKIISRVEDNPMPAKLTAPVEGMLKIMGPKLGLPLNYDNLYGHFPMIEPILFQNDMTNSLIRTTIAFTVTGGGTAENVLPQSAWANANVRIMPGDTLEDIINHMKNLNPDIDFDVEVMLKYFPSPITPTDTESYENLIKAIREVHNDI
ncbi:MAG: M20/M25/M40 family metallo-hydrolase, partial [Tissierellia bacterium]|nr:M20/M25/M40 family metallo-hydrolase [Tissierellia bacterium]